MHERSDDNTDHEYSMQDHDIDVKPAEAVDHWPYDS